MSIHRVLVLLPYSTNSELKKVIEEVLKAHGLIVFTLTRGETEKDEIASILRRSIELADDIIADLTGNNPNIMYQVGYAQGLRKRVLFVVNEKETKLPVDIAGNLFFAYHYDAPAFDLLKKEISEWAVHLIRAKKFADSASSASFEPEEPEEEPPDQEYEPEPEEDNEPQEPDFEPEEPEEEPPDQEYEPEPEEDNEPQEPDFEPEEPEEEPPDQEYEPEPEEDNEPQEPEEEPPNGGRF